MAYDILVLMLDSASVFCRSEQDFRILLDAYCRPDTTVVILSANQSIERVQAGLDRREIQGVPVFRPGQAKADSLKEVMGWIIEAQVTRETEGRSAAGICFFADCAGHAALVGALRTQPGIQVLQNSNPPRPGPSQQAAGQRIQQEARQEHQRRADPTWQQIQQQGQTQTQRQTQQQTQRQTQQQRGGTSGGQGSSRGTRPRRRRQRGCLFRLGAVLFALFALYQLVPGVRNALPVDLSLPEFSLGDLLPWNKEPETLALNVSELTLELGRTWQLQPSGTVKEVSYATSDPYVVAVTPEGLVKATTVSNQGQPRTAEITVFSKKDEDVRVVIPVTVQDSYFLFMDERTATYNQTETHPMIFLNTVPQCTGFTVSHTLMGMNTGNLEDVVGLNTHIMGRAGNDDWTDLGSFPCGPQGETCDHTLTFPAMDLDEILCVTDKPQGLSWSYSISVSYIQCQD